MTESLLTANDRQPQLVKRLQGLIDHNELAHAYLLVGPSGSGKKLLAQWVALRLFCLSPVNSQPDLTCDECQRILSNNHPDLVVAEPDGRQIKVDQIRHLKDEFSKSSVEGRQKVFIIEDAEKMTVNAANSLLKFIEEPGTDIYIFLLTTNKNAILPTIQSRTQVIELQPVSDEVGRELMTQAQIPDYLQPVIWGLTKSVDQAQELLENDWLSQVVKLLVPWVQKLAGGDWLAFVEVQTKWIPLAIDRAHQQVIFDLIMLVVRDLLFIKQGVATNLIHFQQWYQPLSEVVNRLSSEQILFISERTLGLRHQLDQNINFQNILEQFVLQCFTRLGGYHRGA
ncbi:DNA polymerase III subunit delta' [Limosilactobacillus gastricus]|uniref:DNA-directed DNA polymerase III delta prime subunit n=1 Tax=Limosilactobacillus gastricus DSM 16045 TaxID=1423749 RepID=A0A0R1VL99_9LACO|nr:DNA polymerase III subunit delta' [Limosilactobacillus gastricus]KRM03699.1 DNA-directed DNA polymerase III delta prime subunit [Limosilactobacillus gastricus DSM 16045]QGF39881.1 DNA polymerase III subunit delta' [Limosilactobacillus gastricus]